MAEFKYEMWTLVVESIPQKRGSQGRISPKSNCLSSIHPQTDREAKDLGEYKAIFITNVSQIYNDRSRDNIVSLR